MYCMADPEHLKLFMQNVADWNAWREEHPEIVPDLSETWLHVAYHGGLDLHHINLSGADLHQADFQCDISFYGANLCETDLSEASLCNVELRDADLSEANLSGTDLRGANLSRANLSGVFLIEADLRDADLSY